MVLKRGDWVRINSKDRQYLAGKLGRIVAVNEDGLANHVEYGVQFEANGGVRWYLDTEITTIERPRGSHGIPLPPLKKLRAEHLVPGLR